MALVDATMRAEQFERFRRSLKQLSGAGQALPPGVQVKYSDAHPWDAVFAVACHPGFVEAQTFWNREVHHKALHFTLRSNPASSSQGETAAEPAPLAETSTSAPVRQGGPPAASKNKRKRAARKAKAQAARSQARPAGGDTAPAVCDKYNRGACTEPCPAGRRHVCSRCGKGHPATRCPGKGRGKGR